VLKKTALFSLLLILTLLSSCASLNEESGGSGAAGVSSGSGSGNVGLYGFTDSSGTYVEVGFNPETTAVLFSSFADIWKTAGGNVDITVGETVERGFADETAALVDDGAGKSINTEALIAGEPDFVIGSYDIPAQVEAVELLRKAGVPCALFRVECFADYLGMLKICADLTGNADAYDEYGVKVGAEIEEILQKIPQNEENKNVLFIRSGSGASSAKAKTAKEHFAAAMLDELSVHNIADDAPVLLDGLSIEEIIAKDPDMIFISTMGSEQAAREYMDSVLDSPAWQALTAVKEKKYYYLPKDLFQFKPNAKWGEAYRYLARLLYPEVGF